MSNPGWPGSAESSRNHLHGGAATAGTAAQTSSSAGHAHNAFPPLHQSESFPFYQEEQDSWHHDSHQGLPAPYAPSHFASSGTAVPSPTALHFTAAMQHNDMREPGYHSHHDVRTKFTAPAAPAPPPTWGHSHSYQPSPHNSHGTNDGLLRQHCSPYYGPSLDIESMQDYRMGDVSSAPASATVPTSSVLTSLPTSFAPALVRSMDSGNTMPSLSLSSLTGPPNPNSPHIRRLSSAGSHLMDDSSSIDSVDPSPTSQSGDMHFPDLTSTSLSSSLSSPTSIHPLSDQARADEMLKRLRSRSSDSKEGVAACDYCRKRKIRCDRQKPTCGKCLSLGKQCATTDTLRKRGPPSKKEKELLAAQGLRFIPSRVRRRSANDEASREAAINAAAATAHATAQHQQQRHRPSSASSSNSSSLSAIGSTAAQDPWCVARGPGSKAKRGGASGGSRGAGSTRPSTASEVHAMVGFPSSSSGDMLSANAPSFRGINKQRSLDVTGFRAAKADAFGGGPGLSNITTSMDPPSGAIASSKNSSRDSSVSVSARASPTMMMQQRPFLMTLHDRDASAAAPLRTLSDSAAGPGTSASLEQQLVSPHHYQDQYQSISPREHANRDIQRMTMLANSQSGEQGHWMPMGAAIIAPDQHDPSWNLSTDEINQLQQQHRQQSQQQQQQKQQHHASQQQQQWYSQSH